MSNRPRLHNLSSPKRLNLSIPDLTEVMTTQEAAEKLGFNVRSIPYMIKNKTLDGVRVGRSSLVSKNQFNLLKKDRGNEE